MIKLTKGIDLYKYDKPATRIKLTKGIDLFKYNK